MASHGGRRFGKTQVIGLCIFKSDRLSDSHTNCGVGELGAGTLFRFRHIPVPAICFRSSVFPCLPCLALPLRIIMVTLDWWGREYGYVACIYLHVMHAQTPPGSKNKKYKRWIIREENTIFLPRKEGSLHSRTLHTYPTLRVRNFLDYCTKFFFQISFFVLKFNKGNFSTFKKILYHHLKGKAFSIILVKCENCLFAFNKQKKKRKNNNKK